MEVRTDRRLLVTSPGIADSRRSAELPPAQASLAVALAHACRWAEALKSAEAIFKANADRPAILFLVARRFAACAAGGSDDTDRRRASALALDALGAAVRNGCRDPDKPN